MKPGLYPTAQYFIDSLNSLAKKVFGFTETKIQFFYHTASKRCTLRIFDKNVTIQMSPRLQELLHFEDNVYSGVTESDVMRVTGTSPVDIRSETYAVYVYCDLVEHRVVGDVLAPLLRIVSIDHSSETLNHKIYTKPHYIPLTKRHFNAVEILMTADNGKELLFEGGKTVVTLHLRPRRSRV